MSVYFFLCVVSEYIFLFVRWLHLESRVSFEKKEL